MAKMNTIQFQPGLSIDELLEQYGTEAQCETAVEQSRWPEGFECPGCQEKAHCVVWHGGVKTFQCNACHQQTTLTGGTIFHATKLPLRTWFKAMYFLTQSKNNVSALELKRLIGVCYRTAWRLKHKVRQPDLYTASLAKFKSIYTYHAFKFRKYAYRYLSETQYRFNRRFNLRSILPRLVRAAVTTGKRTEIWLRLAEDQH